jgi:hypothetical protein
MKKSISTTSSWLCTEFLKRIGLRVHEVAGASGFTEGVDIRDGELLVDPNVACASNILHEAGHLAIVPPEFRGFFQSNVEGGQRRMLAALMEQNIEPDSPLYRAALNCSDPEATAWAWAAGKHLGLDEEDIIQNHEYGGDGDSIRLQLALNAYAGIHGLARAGFCSTSERLSPMTGLPAFPNLAMWVQPAALSPATATCL